MELETVELLPVDAEWLFQRALSGEATPADQRQFEAHMLMQMARMSVEVVLVIQLHPCSFLALYPAMFQLF